MTFDDFREMGSFKEARPAGFRKYEEKGFPTPSGKVELYSEYLESLGFDPLPTFRKPDSSDDSRVLTEDYDLFCTCRKVTPFIHSQGRQINSLRKPHPDPLVIIHPETAQARGISESDWVYIESIKGRIRQRAKLSTGVDPRVIVAEQGWWFPEGGYEAFFSFAESNYNALMADEAGFSPEVGSFLIRGLACKVYRG
jgi:anaerobic selenocysteine-containing dehydrogenase